MPSTILVDAYGGSSSPDINVQASVEICRENTNTKIILLGDSTELHTVLSHYNKIPDNLSIHHASQKITDLDIPSKVFRQKTDSTIHHGMKLLKDNIGDAFFSTGNTGAIVATSYFTLGLIKPVTRPALSIIYPSRSRKHIVILDLGATMDATPSHLKDFSLLGTTLSSLITGNNHPEVALLSVGEELLKGRSTVKQAASLLKADPSFKGFIEGNHLFEDPHVDVVITDGFTGNVVLKTIEGLSETLFSIIREKMAPYQRWVKLPTFLFKKLFTSEFSRFDYSHYGCALLLGVNGLVGVGHGRSNITACKSGIKSLITYTEQSLFTDFHKNLSENARKSGNYK